MQDLMPVDVVKRMYAAFNSGDVPTFLDLCAPDIEWAGPAIRGLAHYPGTVRGREAVAQIVETLAANEEVQEFLQHNFISQGDRVLVEGSWRSRVKPTGQTFRTNYIHAFTVRNGKVQRYEGYWDTAAHAEAFRG